MEPLRGVRDTRDVPSADQIPASRTRTLAEDQAAVGARWERTTGSAIGRYVVERRIGAGAMGVVYEAVDPRLNRRVAIKMAHASRGNHRRSAERFVREARAMAALHHPHVVKVYDYGVRDDDAYVVMELLQAETLSAWLESKPSTAARLEVLRAAGRGLSAAHEAGLVHRDFKPGNVLVTRGGVAKVTDFGLARAFGEGDSSSQSEKHDISGPQAVSVTAHGVVLGTPLYMSPEQHRAEPLTPLSDQYSYCLTAYEALVGHRLFDARSMMALEQAKERGPDAAAFRTLPRSVARALRRGLQPHARDRFPDLAALLQALEGRPRRTWLVGLAGVAFPLALGGTLAMQGPATACADEDVQLWNADDQVSLRRAFARSEVPRATEIAEHVSAIMEGEARAWSDARQQACSLSGTQQDAVRACLGHRRDAFEALRERVVVRGTVPPERALSVVSRLETAQTCLQPKSARLEAALANPTMRAHLDEVRRRNKSARTALQQGNTDAAKEALAASLETIARVEPPGLRARPLTVVGDMLDTAGDGEQASEVLRKAYEFARAAEDQERAVGAAVHLIWVEGLTLSDVEEGRRWAREAEALLEQLESKPALAAARLNNLAMVAQNEGDLDRALELLEQADAVAATEQDGASPARQNVLLMARAGRANNIGSLRYWKGDYAEALAAFRRSLAATEAARGPDHPDSLSAADGIARAAEALGELDLARASARGMVRTIELHRGKDHLSITHALRVLGTVEYARGDLAEVRRLFERIIALLEAQKDPSAETRRELAAMQVDLCVALREMGDPQAAAELAQRAFETIDAANDPSRAVHRAGALRELALAHSDLAHHDDAVAFMSRADVALQDTKQVVVNGVVFATARVYVFSRAGRYDEAIEAGERGMTLAADVPDSTDAVLLELELARALLLRGQSEDRARAETLLAHVREVAGTSKPSPITLQELAAVESLLDR